MANLADLQREKANLQRQIAYILDRINRRKRNNEDVSREERDLADAERRMADVESRIADEMRRQK